MKKIRTHRFRLTLGLVLSGSALFLLWFLLFGREMATTNLDGMIGAAFLPLALASLSFLIFNFAPYFQREKRWFAISGLLVLVFFAGTVMLWQVPPAALGV